MYLGFENLQYIILDIVVLILHRYILGLARSIDANWTICFFSSFTITPHIDHYYLWILAV